MSGWPPLLPQLVPALTFGFEGVPFVQTSFVHGFPSTGRSVSSTPLTMLPVMHLFLWQSPTVGSPTTVPSAVLVDPHWPVPLHMNVLQAVSLPQSIGWLHCTQAGMVRLPLQRVPPPWLQGAFCALDGFDGTPPVHRSSVQLLPSTKTSVLSIAWTTLPVPLQTFFLQSPGV